MHMAEATRILRTLSRCGNQRKAAKELGIAQSTFSGRFNDAVTVVGKNAADKLLAPYYQKQGLKADGTPKQKSTSVAAAKKSSTGAAVKEPAAHKEPVAPRSESIVKALADGDASKVNSELDAQELRRLRTQMRQVADTALTDEKIRREIFGLAHSSLEVPKWLGSVPATAEDLPGVPILFGSDWHWGEVVNPDEIGGVNKYNLAIANERVERLISKAIDLLTNHMVNPKYPGIVFALGGDMVSGNIHDELCETNDLPIMPVVLDIVGVLVKAIQELKRVFGKVFLPCVAGNHGRLHRKPRAKESNFNSYDWLIYQMLDREFKDDEDVLFYIPDGPDALVEIAGHKYLFTHGNQFRGGDGMIGPLGPITRGDHKKRSRNAQIGHEYDTLVIGHFHQLIQMRRVIVNGSLIGYNEYAHASNFGYEPPQQALWVTHPAHGITFSMPVNVDKAFGKEIDPSKEWVSFSDAKARAKAIADAGAAAKSAGKAA